MHRGWLLTPALLGWIAGCALQLQQGALWPAWVYVLFIALALVLLAWIAIKKRAFRGRWLLMALALMLGGAGLTGARGCWQAQDRLAQALEGRDVVLAGLIASLPQRTEAGLRFRFEVETAALDGREVRVPSQLQLGWYGSHWGGAAQLGELQSPPPTLRVGERWQLTARLKAPHGTRNPHGFDLELWLWEQGIGAVGYVRTSARDAPAQRLAATAWYPVEWLRQRVRDAIEVRLLRPSADTDAWGAQRARWAGVVTALVVGDQQAIERVDWDVFRATGVAHLMSISGLHITMFAWLAQALVGWLWRRSPRLCLAVPASTAGLVAGVGLAAAYALFSGWGVPAQRTMCMLVTVGVLRLSARRWPWPQVWLLACAVVLALDPWAWLQAGFWLSFVAVGILFATDSGAPHADESRAGGRIRAMFREQWVITLALTPLSLLLFGQVSVVGLLANALAIPWVTLLLTPLAMLGVVVPPLWDGAAYAAQGLAVVLGWLARWPWATWSVAQAPVWAGAFGVLGGALLAMPMPWGWRLLGLPLVLPVLCWQPPGVAPGQFAWLAADIGQGNAVLVQTAHHALLYDSGPRYSVESDAGHRVLVPLLRALDVRLDTLVLSHRDSDHTGGAPAVLAMQPQAALLSSIEAGHALQRLRPVTRCEAGQHWEWDAVRFEVLHPTEADYDNARRSNALSCVLRVSNGTQTLLLAGDIEAPQERALLAAGAPLHATVLLVPHHGSKTSSSAAFLDAVAPELALVQAGYRNRFGHPAPAVLARYAERGVRVMDSAHCGAAQGGSDAPQTVRCERSAARHYWQHDPR